MSAYSLKGYYLSNILRKQLGNKREYNPINVGNNLQKEKYRELYTNYDLQQNCMIYTWSGEALDELTLSSMDIERMLYYRATLAGFNIGGLPYLLPYAANGSLNAYGMSTEIEPLMFNGEAASKDDKAFSKGLKLPVISRKNKLDDTQAVLLFGSLYTTNNGEAIPRYYLNQIIIDDIADTLARVNISIVVANKKIGLIVKDPNQKAVVDKEIATAFASDSPFFTISSPIDTQVIQDVGDFQGDELFNVIKNYDSMRCFMSGIHSKHFGTEKKERLISDEMDGDREQADLVAIMGLRLRERFCKQAKEYLGWDIHVELTSDLLSDEDVPNVDGEDEEEEEVVEE